MSIHKTGRRKNGKDEYQIRCWRKDQYGKNRAVKKLFLGTLTEAREEEARLKGCTILEGSVTFAQACEYYISVKNPAESYANDLRYSCRIISDKQEIISKWTPVMFSAFLNELSKGKSPRTVNKIATQICSIVKIALKTRFMEEPVEFLDSWMALKVPKAEKQLLKLHSLDKYFEGLDVHAVLLIKFLLYSGCRLSAACRLQWTDIIEDEIHLNEKFGKCRVVIITARIRNILDQAREIHQHDNNYVFQQITRGNKISMWNKTKLQNHILPHWQKLHPGEKGLGVHRLRHSLASYGYQECGLTQAELGTLLGHTHPASIKSYLVLNAPVVAASALDKIHDRLEKKSF